MNAPLLHARPDTTSSARLGGLCDPNFAYAGAERSRTGSFLPPQPIPDPKVQIDLREPEEIARAKAREDYDLWSLLQECWAAVDAEEAVWAEEARAARIARGEPADAPRKVVARSLDVDADDPYLAEERALRQAETGIVEDEDDGRDEHRALAIAHDDEPEDEDDPERDGEPAE